MDRPCPSGHHCSADGTPTSGGGFGRWQLRQLSFGQPQAVAPEQGDNDAGHADDADIEYGPATRRWPVLTLNLCMRLCFWWWASTMVSWVVFLHCSLLFSLSFGMTEDQVAALGLAAVGNGALAASLLPAFLCKNFGPGYKNPWKILHVGQMISFSMVLMLVVLFVTAKNNDDDTTTSTKWFVPCVSVVSTCVEIFLVPIFPTTMALVAETIYPKPAAIGGSIVIGAVSNESVATLVDSNLTSATTTRTRTRTKAI